MIPALGHAIAGDLLKNNVTGDVCLLLKIEKTWVGDDDSALTNREIRYITVGPHGDIVNSSAGFWDKVSV